MKRLIAMAALLLLPATCAAQTTVRALGGNVEPGGTFWVVIEIKPSQSIKGIAGTFWVNSTRLQIDAHDQGTAIIPWGSNATTEVFDQQQAVGRIGFRVKILNGNTCCGPSNNYSHFFTIAVRDRGGAGAPTFGFDDSVLARSVTSSDDSVVNTSWVGATLSVIPSGTGRTLNVDSLVLIKGQVTPIPVWLRTLGNENAVSFTMLFSPLHISVEAVRIGPFLPAGASVTVNWTGFGRLGIIVALPPGQRFIPGTNLAALLDMRASNGFSPLVSEAMHVWFSDSPVQLELVSDTAQTLPFLLFQYTNLLIVPGVEGDVAPRPAGNAVTSLADWVQIGRFAALLDDLTPGLEFMKADCAPRSTGGDGRLTLSDYVQAGRFAAALDLISYAWGPTSLASFAPESNLAVSNRDRPDLHTRTILLTQVPSRKADATYAVELRNGEGDENAVSFSLELPESMKFISAEPDDPGAAFHVNQSVPGKIGVILAAQPRQGLGRRLVTLRFEGKGDVKFAEGTVAGELVDVNAEAVAVVFGAERTRIR